MSYLTSDLLSLRALERNDIDWLFSLENDSDLWQVSDTLVPFSKDILEQYILRASEDIYTAKQLRLVIDHCKKPVGMIDLFDFDFLHKRAGVGIVITSENREKGFGKEALMLLKTYVFEYLGLHQLYAQIAADNLSSLALFQKQGFVITGTKKNWQKRENTYTDIHFLQCIYTPSKENL